MELCPLPSGSGWLTVVPDADKGLQGALGRGLVGKAAMSADLGSTPPWPQCPFCKLG